MSSVAAEMIIDTVNKKPNALLCFATGDTPKLTYHTLQEIAKEKGVNFSKCFFVGLDEWIGISPQNTGSWKKIFRTRSGNQQRNNAWLETGDGVTQAIDDCKWQKEGRRDKKNS